MKIDTQKIKAKFGEYLKFLRGKKYSPFVVGLLATILVWIFGAIFVFIITRPRTERPVAPKPSVEEIRQGPVARRALDGLAVAEGWVEPYVCAAMIDNHVDARPQSGLSKASLVFEIPAESGITRFMALFLAGQPVEKIGPIRSARPYYIDYASEFGAAYLHVGGSPAALEKLSSKTSAVTNMDEYFLGKTFYRSRDRLAPHNTYTSNTSIEAYLQSKDLKANYAPWLFRDDSKAEEISGKKGVKIAFSTPAYEAEWRYDLETNDYLRYTGRTKYKDQDGSEVRAKNVAVVVTTSQVLDNAGRLSVKTTGEGKAYVIQEGKVIEGKWKKYSATDRLRFFDADDNEVEFVAGVTWVEVVFDERKVMITE
ncbi:MAG: DUF3048 domain-containing protein [bacterium]